MRGFSLRLVFMFVSEYQAELEYCLARAAELLGGAARPLWLDWEIETAVEKQLVVELRRGLGPEPPMVCLDRSKQGHYVVIGMEQCRWETADGPVRIVKVSVPRKSSLGDFWAVRQADYRRFRRLVRRAIHRQDAQGPPVMPDEERRRLWDNTIGFLLEGQAEMARYGITPRRGVLLLGTPGNGKTTACRWLAAACREHGLEWRSVTVADYQNARAEREVPGLFQLRSPGIVLFDDFDAPLRGDGRGDPEERSTFLTELDGIRQKAGVVTMFTTNAEARELDPAMLRPGRIDVIIRFPKPEAAMRRRLIEDRWHPDLVSVIDVERVVSDTAEFSFAELEEAKKLLVLSHYQTGRWDWTSVRRTLRRQRPDRAHGRPIGFAPPANGHPDRALPLSPGPAAEGPNDCRDTRRA